MDLLDTLLQIDPQAVSSQIEDFLRSRMQALGRHGILLGFSGGLDSSIVAYLATRAIGPDKVRLLYLPDRDSKPVHGGHAERVAGELGVPLERHDLTPILDEIGVYKLLPISRFPGLWTRSVVTRLGKKLLGFKKGASVLEARLRPEPDSYVSRGNTYGMTKHRLRMLLLYQQAEIGQLLLAGAANRTEWMTGTFSLWGCDHCADVMPIIHLYRTQLNTLAQYLGVPEVIRNIPADPDIVPGVDDKGEMLGSFHTADRVLIGLEKGMPREQLVELCGSEAVERITRLFELSQLMRDVPYSIIREFTIFD